MQTEKASQPDTNTARPQPGPPLPNRAMGVLGYDRTPTGLLAQLRIRKKLILLHTIFSAAFAAILLLAMRPALAAIVRAAETTPAGQIVRNDAVREAASDVYILLAVALFAVYILIAIGLEIFVLPRHVYAPIRIMLRAERAVQENDPAHELIPDEAMPADEMGEIMRSRNESIRALRRSERDLAVALTRFEEVASDLKRKNHLLENARQNLEGADRLASLGMMSAGIAHELNTPLAVAKGLVEKLANAPESGLPQAEAALLKRVVGRLERLSESLLDFARARPTVVGPTRLADVVSEAITLVRLDRGGEGIEIGNAVPQSLELDCDADRIIQVFVNLIRNAIDVLAPRRDIPDRTVEINAMIEHRDTAEWVVATIRDNGPGIDAEVLPTLFDPFVSTRLDAKGTGLGLAVAEGIVKEHAGAIIARNRTDARGAVFEIVLPRKAPGSHPRAPQTQDSPSINPAASATLPKEPKENTSP